MQSQAHHKTQILVTAPITNKVEYQWRRNDEKIALHDNNIALTSLFLEMVKTWV